MNNITQKNKYKRIEDITNIKNIDDIDLLIKRSVGYFKKIVNDGKTINKGHILNYYFILEDILREQEKRTPPITYGTNNKIIVEYGEYILTMRFKNTSSYNMIVKELKSKYKKTISKTMIFNFININKLEWEKYYEFS